MYVTESLIVLLIIINKLSYVVINKIYIFFKYNIMYEITFYLLSTKIIHF